MIYLNNVKLTFQIFLLFYVQYQFYTLNIKQPEALKYYIGDVTKWKTMEISAMLSVTNDTGLC